MTRWASLFVFSLLLLSAEGTAPWAAETASTPSAPSSVSPRKPMEASPHHRRPTLAAPLRFLQGRAQAGKLAGGDSALLPVSVRFDQPPRIDQLAALAALGMRFHPAPSSPSAGSAPSRRTAGDEGGSSRQDRRPGVLDGPEGPILGGITVVPGRIPAHALDAAAAVEGVVRVETAWHPRRLPPLYQTRSMCGVDEAWKAVDREGHFLDGRGVLLADMDTGVDLQHPDFWHGDGGVFEWIDVDLSGDLSEGDAVDVNRNGLVDFGERLGWWEAPGNAPGLEPGFQTDVDHLYQDTDENGVRDWGAPTYSDSDPCFGEPFLRANDENGDHILQPWETLTMLSTCKVKAIWERDDTVRRLGVDLIENEGDTYGHGTNVGSILLGGEKGRLYSGFAPGADMIYCNLDYFPEHPFVTPIDVRMSWAAAEGAEVFVYEDGEWIWEFLDGSSNVEILMNELAEEGSIHVAAAGNLASGGMHWEGDLGAALDDSVTATLTVASPSGTDIGVVWGDFYWNPAVEGQVRIDCVTPTGERVSLGGSGTTLTVGNFSIYTADDMSPRSTARVDFRLEAIEKGSEGTRALDGDWRFVAIRTLAGDASIRMNAMSWDNLSGWFAYSRWQDALITGTVTWPGTADSSITVAAYSPQTLDINYFSGRGKRVDGVSIVDLAAPGSTTYTGRRNQSDGGIPGGYGSFGGTSAATPHVAGAVTLLKQWDRNLHSGEMRRILREGAVQDLYTGTTPNDTWGAGKLNVYGSILWSPVAAPGPPPLAARELLVHGGYPNPFNPATTIRYELPEDGEVVVEVLDLAGRHVATLLAGQQTKGEAQVRWAGRDDAGHAVGSGIYLVRVRQNGREAARKVTLLK